MGNIASHIYFFSISNTTQVTIALFYSRKIISPRKIILQVRRMAAPNDSNLHDTKVEEERKC